MADMIRIFPTCILKTNIGREFSKPELQAFKELGVYSSNIGNMISASRDVLKDKRLKSLHSFCLKTANEYMQEIIRPADDCNLYVTQSWLNKTVKGAFHHKHWHSNSILSGVLYINANEESDRIYFTNPVQESSIQFKVADYTLDNSKTWFVPVKSGDILIFQSQLQHHVDANANEYDRTSLAFNTFIKGQIGEESRSNLLTI